MQTKKPQLQRQQMIMKHLGFYSHKCDGIWGPEAIAAKKEWERDPSFIPALPTNGLPFGDRDPLPKGVQYDRATRLLTLNGMTEENIAEYMPKASAPEPMPEPVAEEVPEVLPVESVASEDETEQASVQSEETQSEHKTQTHNGFGKKHKHRR